MTERRDESPGSGLCKGGQLQIPSRSFSVLFFSFLLDAGRRAEEEWGGRWEGRKKNNQIQFISPALSCLLPAFSGAGERGALLFPFRAVRVARFSFTSSSFFFFFKVIHRASPLLLFFDAGLRKANIWRV